MITKEEWNVFEQGQLVKGQIEDYITEVYEVIFNICGSKLDYWNYSKAFGEIKYTSTEIYVEAYTFCSFCHEEMYFEDEEYQNYLYNSFPIHFLFLSLDEIKERFTNFKVKQKKEVKKLKKDNLKKNALKKLTKEEAEALGIK